MVLQLVTGEFIRGPGRGAAARGIAQSLALGAAGGVAVDWFSSALALLGDIVDPFLPGFAGSELRATSRKVTISQINAQRAAAGLPPLTG
ncbi:hypothetical protein LCGC14_2276470, partial [marine sediment metagenome]